MQQLAKKPPRARHFRDRPLTSLTFTGEKVGRKKNKLTAKFRKYV